MEPWMWILLAIIVIALLVVWLASNSRRRKLEEQRAQAEVMRRRAEASKPAVQAAADRASVTAQIAADARSEADEKAAEAARLEQAAAQHTTSAEQAQADLTRTLREADRLDPDVRTDAEGYRVDAAGNRIGSDDAPAVAGSAGGAGGAGAAAAAGVGGTAAPAGVGAHALAQDDEDEGEDLADAENPFAAPSSADAEDDVQSDVEGDVDPSVDPSIDPSIDPSVEEDAELLSSPSDDAAASEIEADAAAVDRAQRSDDGLPAWIDTRGVEEVAAAHPAPYTEADVAPDAPAVAEPASAAPVDDEQVDDEPVASDTEYDGEPAEEAVAAEEAAPADDAVSESDEARLQESATAEAESERADVHQADLAADGPQESPDSPLAEAEQEDALTADPEPARRMYSELHEVVDGGYGFGSAAPVFDGAQPMGHAVKGWNDTHTFLSPGAPGYDDADPDVWFYSDAAAEAAGFRRVGD